MKRFLTDWTLALVAAAVIVVFLGWLNRGPSTPEVAPDFTVQTTDGGSFTLSEQEGKTVVVNFWADWCGPCLEEIPHFSRFAKENPDVKVIGIAVQSKASKVSALEKKMNISYPISIPKAGDPVLDDYAITVFPTTFVINGAGMITSGRIERGLGYDELESLVDRASVTN